jgi:hypothetical protein
LWGQWEITDITYSTDHVDQTTGEPPGPGWEAIGEPPLRPALMAGRRSMNALRSPILRRSLLSAVVQAVVARIGGAE